MSDTSPKKSKSLVAVILTAIVAGGVWFAEQRGWLSKNSEASGNGGSTARTEQPETPNVERDRPAQQPKPTKTADVIDGADVVAEARRKKLTKYNLTASGIVFKTLPDDNVGSRHQKFLVRLSDRTSLLISHNIDLAPRVPLDEGDLVTFKGDYEWNDKGGVVHWTHHAPRNNHPHGWIKHDGKTYQ